MNKLIEEQERLEKGINECECDNKTGFAQLELGRCNICDVMFAKHEGIRFAGEEVIKIIDEEVQKWAVGLGIYESAELVNIPDTLDLVKRIRDALGGKDEK